MNAMSNKAVFFGDIPINGLFRLGCGCECKRVFGRVALVTKSCGSGDLRDQGTKTWVGETVTVTQLTPLETAPQQPTEPEVQAAPEVETLVVWRVVRVRLGCERQFGHYRIRDDANSIAETLRRNDRDSLYLVEAVAVK